jgi:ribonuclease E
VVEPDWFADGDFAWLDAAEVEAGGQVEAVAVPEAPAEAEPAEAEPPVEAEAAPETPAAPEPALEFEAPADFEPWQPPEASVPEVATEPDVADAPEPQTMSATVAVQDVEEEVMWLGTEPEASQPVTDEPPVQGQAEVQTWPTADATPAVEVVRPPLAMTEEELSRLALDEGWDEAEVAAIRAMITPPPEPRVVLPGATELDEAMAALEAVPVRSDPGFEGTRQWAKPAPDDDVAPAIDDWAFEAEPPPQPPSAPRPPADVTAELRRGAGGAGRLRPREGPAAAAYRRLRRLLPG